MRPESRPESRPELGLRLGPGFWAALLAGGIYAFASAKLFYAALGQFNIASSQWIPFCALYLVRMVHARSLRGKLREAALAGLFLVFQAWAELTYASFLLLLIGLLFLWAMLFGEGWRGRLRATAGFLLVGAIFVLGLLPFLAAMAPDLAAEGDFFGRGGGFADVFSADLAGYLAPTRLHPLVGAWVAGLPFPNDKGQQIYLGYSVLLLALAGAWGLWRGLGGGGRGSAAVTPRRLLFGGSGARDSAAAPPAGCCSGGAEPGTVRPPPAAGCCSGGAEPEAVRPSPPAGCCSEGTEPGTVRPPPPAGCCSEGAEPGTVQPSPAAGCCSGGPPPGCSFCSRWGRSCAGPDSRCRCPCRCRSRWSAACPFLAATGIPAVTA